MAKLVFLDHEWSGKTYELTAEKTTVGRSSQNLLVLHDHSVSAQHCEFLVYGNEVIVRDCGSANGTYVDGARVTGQMQVRAGQVVQLGAVSARLELDPPSGIHESELTAVKEYARLQRQMAKPEKEPLHVELGGSDETDPSAEERDETIVLPRAKGPGNPPPLPDPEPGPPLAASHRTRNLLLLTAAALLVGLGLLALLSRWW